MHLIYNPFFLPKLNIIYLIKKWNKIYIIQKKGINMKWDLEALSFPVVKATKKVRIKSKNN